MQEASQAYVAIPELQEAVGKRIADLLRVDGALVKSGRSAHFGHGRLSRGKGPGEDHTRAGCSRMG